MHLYQYLPGTFKATSSNTSYEEKRHHGGSIDLTESTSNSNSTGTPNVSNLARHNVTRQKPVDHSKKQSAAPTKHRTSSAPPQRQRASASVEQERPCPRRGSIPDNKPQTEIYPQDEEKQNDPQQLQERYQITVGQGFSQEASVTSDLTNPTVLTYPKIGPGYSDTVTVTSDLSIPTVMTGMVPQEELKDLNEWHLARARAAAATPRKTKTSPPPPPLQRKKPQHKSLSSIREEENVVSFEKQTKSGRYTSRDIDDRLLLLKSKSIKKLSQEEEKQLQERKTTPPPIQEEVVTEEKEPTRSPSEMMEEVVWTTLLHLEEQSACDEESVATPILKEMMQERHVRKTSSGGSVCSETRRLSRRNRGSGKRRSKSHSVDRSQSQTFSFVW